MSCARHAAALTDHAIGAPLDPAAQAHLDGCADCRARLQRDRRAMAMLDADLADALTVEPSADFQAQVRERVADEEPVPVRFWQRPLVLAAAASAVVVIGLLVLQLARRVPTGTDAPNRPDLVLHVEDSSAPTATVDNASRKPQPVPEPLPRGRRPAVVERVTTHRSMEPAVIVPPDRAAAIRRYVTAVAQGRAAIPEGALPGVASAAPEIAPLTVDPIVIPPSEGATSKTSDPGFYF